MNWLEDILHFLGFDTSNNWVFFSQLATLIPISIFGIKSLKVFYKESISEYNQQGAMPVLAAVYSIISIFYCYIFIKNFGTIINIANLKVLNSLNYLDNQFLYTFAIRLLASTALVAFSFNFLKSLYTLNSLEFGLLTGVSLNKILNNDKKKALFEAFIRLIVAGVFICLEKKLGTTNYIALKAENSNPLEFKGEKFILILGCWIAFLYSLLLIWLLFLQCFLDKECLLGTKWYKNSFWQFFFGLIVGLIFIFIGYASLEDFKVLLLILLSAGVVSSFGVIITILINEKRKQVNGKLQHTTN